MKLGIGSYTYGWATGAYGFSDPDAPRPRIPMDAMQLIDRAVELDVPVVQICFRPALHELSSTELDDIASYAAERGRELEIGTVGSDATHLRQYASIAVRLKASLVRTIFPGASVGLRQERSAIAEVAPFFESNRIVLAVENHEDYSCRDLATMVQELESPFVAVCLDAVNSLGRGEGIREVIEALLPLTRCVHVKDFASRRRPSGMGFEVVGAVPGQGGRLDIPGFLTQVARLSEKTSVILEQWTDFGDSLEQSMLIQERDARQAIDLLRSAIAGLPE